MKVRPVLGLVLGMLLTVGVGCAGSSSEDTAGSDSDLRALQAGDIDMPLITSTPAQSVPDKFASIKSWKMDYVEMADPIPDNNFKGLMMFGLDSTGATVYSVPLGYIGADATSDTPGAPSLAIFSADTDGSGSLVPVTFMFADTNEDATVASEKAALSWVMSEQTRMMAMLNAQQTGATQLGTASLGIQSGVGVNIAFCAAHVAALFLAPNPIAYFVVDGLITLGEGAVELSGDRKAGLSTVEKGGFMAAMGGMLSKVAAAVTRSPSTALKTGASVAGKVAVGGVVAFDAYENYRKATGTTTNKVLGTAGAVGKDFLPDSCKQTLVAAGFSYFSK